MSFGARARRGSILKTSGRGVTLGALCNGLVLVKVQAFYGLLATRIIIIVAMPIDRLTRGKQGVPMNDPGAAGPHVRTRLPGLATQSA